MTDDILTGTENLDSVVAWKKDPLAQKKQEADEYYLRFLEEQEQPDPQKPITLQEKLQHGLPLKYETDLKREGERILNALQAGATKEEILAEEEGLKILVYDPIDLGIDIASVGIVPAGRAALKVLRQAVKEGDKLLAKTAAKKLGAVAAEEVGFGAAAGGSMAIAEYMGAGGLIQALSGLMGPLAASTLLTMSRKGIAKWMAHTKKTNLPLYESVKKAALMSEESPLRQVILAEGELPILPSLEELNLPQRADLLKQQVETIFPEGKPWEITRAQFEKRYRTQTVPSGETIIHDLDGAPKLEIEPGKDAHHALVEAALFAGEPVPQSVLKDYPDLIRKYSLESFGVGDKNLIDIVEIIDEKGLDPAIEAMLAPYKGDLPKYAININLNRINTTDDVKAALDNLTSFYQKDFEKLRGKKQTFQDTQRLANLTNMTVEELLARASGEAWSAPRILAARHLLVSSQESILKEAQKIASGVGTDLDKANFTERLAVHFAILGQVSGLASEAGRALNQFKIMAKNFESGMIRLEEFLNLTKGKLPIEKVAEKIADLDTPEGLTKVVGGLYKATTWDKFIELWINGLLSNPVTHMVNSISNTLTGLWMVPERFLASQIGKITPGAKTGGVAAGEAVAMVYGMVNGLKDAARMFAKTMRDPETADSLTKYEMPRRAINIEGGGIMGKAVDYMIHAPTTALLAEDEFFKAVAYRTELHARAYRKAIVEEGLSGEKAARRIVEIINNPPPDIKYGAVDYSRYVTFTQPAGAFAGAITQAAEAVPYLRMIIPFIRTPVNIVKFGLERTPAVLASRKFWETITQGTKVERDMALAKLGLGTVVMLSVMELAHRGDITGGGPSDRNAKAVFRRTKQPYSIRVGDKWLAYSRIEPAGIVMGLAADLADIFEKMGEREYDEAATAALVAISKNLASKTWTKGLFDFVEAIEEPDRRLPAWARRMVGTVVPAGVAQIERVKDPEMEDVRTFIDAVKARIPGKSREVPPRLDLFGETIESEKTGITPIDMLNPIYIQSIKDEPIYQEFERLGYFPGMPDRQIDGIPLKPWEYYFYVKSQGEVLRDPTTGLNLKETLEDLIKQPYYQMLSDGKEGGKATLIQRYISQFRKMAREEFYQPGAQESFPDLWRLLMQKKYYNIR
jgi:hypothetical protein